MNFLKLTMIDTPSPRDADASKNHLNSHLKSHLKSQGLKPEMRGITFCIGQTMPNKYWDAIICPNKR